MSSPLRRAAFLAAVLPALAGGLTACGGGSSDEDPPSAAATPTTSTGAAGDPEARRSATAYAATMKPIARSLVAILRGVDLRRNARDFDRGVALLRERKRMARVTADPGLLLAHDRLAQATSRAGTLLVAAPGSEVARASRAAGVPPGTQTAAVLVGNELTSWARETEQQLRDAGAPVPGWLPSARAGAERVTARATATLR